VTRHPFDVFAACAGLTFSALAIGFLLDGLDVWDLDTTWFAPLLLIVLGVAGVLSTVVNREAEDASPDPPDLPDDVQ
jgi:uncharacterized membrane protein